MATTALVTGPPRSGKTTALERTASRLRSRGLTVAGLACPEIRDGGQRVGFEIVDLASGERATMAHVDRANGPTVGTYAVDVDAIDRVAAGALGSPSDSDCVVIDEIAPMQLESDAFVRATREAIAASTPTVAAAKLESATVVLDEPLEDTPVDRFAVTPDNREDLPDRLAGWIAARVDPR